MKYVVGHKSPDTDSVVSAIAYSEFLRSKGIDVSPACQGEINDETKFVLEKFGFSAPAIVTNAGDNEFYLVDHNSQEESVEGLEEDKILGIIDHHKIRRTTSKPIYFHVEPLGSTATIISKFMFESNFEISKHLAGILLGALLSDTVIFKSPTTTEEDKEIAKKLAEIAEIEDIESFGIEVKKKKADVSGVPAKDVITSDFKEFETNGIRYAVGQVELVDLSDIKARKAEFLEEMEKLRSEKNLDFLILAVTDIMREGSELWVVGNLEIPEKAFGKLEENSIWLDGVMSRKIQIIPPIDGAINN